MSRWFDVEVDEGLEWVRVGEDTSYYEDAKEAAERLWLERRRPVRIVRCAVLKEWDAPAEGEVTP